MGIGSQTSTQILARFKTDVIDLHPKFAVIEGGVNDIAGGTITRETFLSNYKKMLDSCTVHGIKAIVCKVMPWTAGSTANMRKRDSWNDGLDSLVTTYYNAGHDFVCIDFDTYIGQYDATGDPGNLWDIKTEYNSGDNVHFNIAGYTKIAEVIDPYLRYKK